MEAIFKEELFLQNQVTSPLLVSLIALHSANKYAGLRITGLKLEELDQEFHGLPQGWDVSESGVFTFIYQNQNERFQFKFVTNNGSSWVNTFGVKIGENDRLFQHQIDISKLKLEDSKALFESVQLRNYITELQKFMKKPEPVKEQNPVKTTIFVDQPRPQGLFWNQPRNPEPDFNSFGRADLDPTGRGPLSGGNLMGPSFFNSFQTQQQQQPGNSLRQPPGARFDPFGPDPTSNGSFHVWEQPKRNFPF